MKEEAGAAAAGMYQIKHEIWPEKKARESALLSL